MEDKLVWSGGAGGPVEEAVKAWARIYESTLDPSLAAQAAGGLPWPMAQDRSDSRSSLVPAEEQHKIARVRKYHDCC